MSYQEKVYKHKNQILENISLSKEKGLNKLSAILAIEDEDKEKIERELIQLLLDEGYRVSTTKGDYKILTIEW